MFGQVHSFIKTDALRRPNPSIRMRLTNLPRPDAEETREELTSILQARLIQLSTKAALVYQGEEGCEERPADDLAKYDGTEFKLPRRYRRHNLRGSRHSR